MMSPLQEKSLPETSRSRVRSWLLPGIYLALAGGTLAVYSGTFHNEFILYDDDLMIYENPRVSGGLSHDGLKFALTGPHVNNWHPLTTLSHLVDCQLFGVKPKNAGWHHLVNVILHVASVLMLFEALRRMTADLWPSALVAALFAIHPLRVESVAWAAERKDVLSGCFWMLTMLAYIRYARCPSVLRYLVVALAFCLGLMSKPMLVTLPCVLLLLDWWPLERWRSGRLTAPQEENVSKFPEQTPACLILEKLPLLAAAAVVAGVTVFMQINTGAAAPLASVPIHWRLTTSVVAYVFYFWKTIWPTGLAVLYPHPGLAPSPDFSPWLALALGATLLLLTGTGCVLYLRDRFPYLLVGWFWYLGTLVPVIGLVQVGNQAFADRYTYLPLIGVFLAVGWGGRDLVRHWPRTRHPLVLLATLWLSFLMVVAWQQVGYWRNSQTLLEHTLQVTADNAVIHLNLGNAMQSLGRFDEAMTHYQQSLRIDPNLALAHNNWGNALAGQGRSDEAMAHYLEALRIKPDYVEAHYNLGNALLALKRFDESIDCYQEALRIRPTYAEAHNNLGTALAGQGRFAEAMAHYQEALRNKPEHAEAHYNWGRVLTVQGRLQDAVEHFQQALRLNPDLTAARDNLRRTEALLQQKHGSAD